MERRIGLLFDCLRAPYDAAHIVQIALALGNCDLYISGNSISFNNPKITSKVKSWGIKKFPEIKYFDDLEQASKLLHDEGRILIGTTPYAKKSLYDLDLSGGRAIFVFGNETTGLGRVKSQFLDDLVSVPATDDISFFTLPSVVPIVAYEYHRQMRCIR